MANIEVSQYDIYKNLYANMDPLDDSKLSSRLNTIGNWFGAKLPNTYFMLLCRERNDYTIFKLKSPNYYQACQELKETLQSRGDIIDIEYIHGDDCYQCWVKNTGAVSMYMLFPCDDFVIEIGDDVSV